MERNISLDYFKISLSLLVVFRHLSMDVIFGPNFNQHLSELGFFAMWEIVGLGKLPVPIFMMISGYYIDFTDKKKTIKFLIRILQLYIVWSLFYFPWYANFNVPLLIVSLLQGWYHIWYLPAVIVGAILYYFIRKTIENDFLILFIVMLLFVIGFVIQLYQSDHLNIFNQIKFRNGPFVGLPFIAIGHLIRTNDLSKYRKYLPVLAVLGVLLVLGETYIYWGPMLYYDLYLTSIIASPLLFIFVLQYGKLKKLGSNTDITLISSGIYFTHPFFLLTRNAFLPDTELILFYYPCIALLSIFAGVLIIQVNKSIKIFL